MKFLSIVIPYYNLPPELLKRCIQSIIDQNMESGTYEIIVVDDGSTEPPTWLNDTYPKEIVRHIAIEHAGLGAARNAGLQAAEGKYIQFTDADDCLVPGSLNECIELLHTEAPQILRFKYKICRNDKDLQKESKVRKFSYSYTISGAAYMAENNLPGSSCIYFFQKDLATRHNILFKEATFHEDDEFSTRLHYFATSLISTDAAIYNYCIRKDSITNNSNYTFEEKRLNDLFEMLKRLTVFRDTNKPKSNSIQRKAIERKLSMLTVDTMLNLFYNGKKAKAIVEACKKQLTPIGLYPLPLKKYGFKYYIFRTLANNKAGIYLLRLLLPKQKPQKR